VKKAMRIELALRRAIDFIDEVAMIAETRNLSYLNAECDRFAEYYTSLKINPPMIVFDVLPTRKAERYDYALRAALNFAEEIAMLARTNQLLYVSSECTNLRELFGSLKIKFEPLNNDQGCMKITLITDDDDPQATTPSPNSTTP
jgi:hypothetical protein